MSGTQKRRVDVKDKVKQLDAMMQWLAEQYGINSYRLNMLEASVNQIITALGGHSAETPEDVAEGEGPEDEAGIGGVRIPTGEGLHEGAGEVETRGLDLELAVRAADGQAGEANELHSGLPGPATGRGDDLLRSEGVDEGRREREAEDSGGEAANVQLDTGNEKEEA